MSQSAQDGFEGIGLYGTACTAGQIMHHVRSMMDRVPDEEDDASVPVEVVEDASRTVSDRVLLQEVNAAQQHIALQSKALYMSDLHATYTGPLSGIDYSGVLRPVFTGVYVYDTEAEVWRSARHRSVNKHKFLEDAGRKATATHPVFTWDGQEVDVFPKPDTETEVQVRIQYIARPDRVRSTSDSIALPVWFWNGLVLRVAAKCELHVERQGMHDVYMQMHNMAMRPFVRSLRMGRPEAYQQGRRINEPEENTEL